MKKIAVFIFTLIFTFSAIMVNAATPDFLYRNYNNYTATGSMTLTFDSSDDLVKLLEEIEMPEEINNYVDLKALFKSLLSQNSTMKVQVDVSEDYTEAEIAVTTDTQQKIIPNNNLNVDITAKTGMWIKMDLNNQIFNVIYSEPTLNKYMVVELFDIIPDEEAKIEILTMLKSIFNKEYIDSVTKFSADIFAKYAEIKVSGSKCTVKIDNEALISIMNETMSYVMNGFMPEMQEEMMSMEFPSFEGLQILGDKGITYTYSLLSGRPISAEINADISIDISKIYTLYTGREWEFNTPGLLNFTLQQEQKYSNYGKTKVEFPGLTEENSFNIKDMIPEYQPDDEEYEPYPYYYACGYGVENLPVIDGEIYVPLRQTLVSAYENTVVIGYDNGIITATCDYFPGFKELKLTVDSTTVYLDGQGYEIDKVYAENGTTFVSSKTFEELFGWEFIYASYDMISNSFDYNFYTNK